MLRRLVVALSSLLALTGAGVVGIHLLLAGTSIDRVAALAPADTVLYIRVHLEPSAGQQAEIAALARRLPGFADTSALDEKIDQVTQNLLGQLGIDYGADVRPWLGDQVALAASAEGLSSETPTGVLLAAVRDPEAARAALPRLAPDAQVVEYEGAEIHGGGGTFAALLGDVMVFGSAARDVERVIDVDRGARALGDAPRFTASMARLPVDQVASLYLDPDPAIGAVDSGDGQALSIAVVARANGARLTGELPLDGALGSAFATAGGQSSLADWMPAETTASMTLFGGDRVLEGLEELAAVIPELESLTDALSAARTLATFGLGFDLDATLTSLLSGEVGIALSGIGTDAPDMLVLLRPSDSRAIGALDELVAALEDAGAEVEEIQNGGAPVTNVEVSGLGALAFAEADGVLVTAPDAISVQAALTAHESDDVLGRRPAYDDAFETLDERDGHQMWLDVVTILGDLGVADALPSDARDILQRIGAFALAAPVRDDAVQIRAILTVE